MKFAKEHWERISLFANSIGAWFSMLSFGNERLRNCLFVSPVLDMKRLILKMMSWANISEEQLKKELIISTTFGQTFSWEYWEYASSHPITKWEAPTKILYGENDNLIDRDEVEYFSQKFHCGLAVIDYIENHLNGKIDLETVATAVNYSKYHLHRMFTETVGLTIHDYIQRRQLTEAAKLLVFSDKPIIEIAFICGYESQQSFTTAFTSMYKTSPAQYRDRQEFYPLQLRFAIHNKRLNTTLTKNDIRFAVMADIPSWMKLLRLVVDGYPVLDEADYLYKLKIFIKNKQALVLKDGDLLIGAMAFSVPPCSIEYMGIHPQYRKSGIQRIFLEGLLEVYYPEQDIYITTYREGDKADTGYRKELQKLGFAERELLVEFGYPTQRFVFPAKYSEEK